MQPRVAAACLARLTLPTAHSTHLGIARLPTHLLCCLCDSYTTGCVNGGVRKERMGQPTPRLNAWEIGLTPRRDSQWR